MTTVNFDYWFDNIEIINSNNFFLLKAWLIENDYNTFGALTCEDVVPLPPNESWATSGIQASVKSAVALLREAHISRTGKKRKKISTK